MYETPADRSELQELLDRSIGASGSHLRSIVEPDTHTLTADQVIEVLTGMTTLALATVTAAGEPRVSGVDGHLLRGRFVFTTTASAVKARHLRRRPAVSAAHLVGDDPGVFVHGHARFLDVDTPAESWVEDHLVAHYGSSPRTWAPDVVDLRIESTWMVAYAPDPDALLAARTSPAAAVASSPSDPAQVSPDELVSDGPV